MFPPPMTTPSCHAEIDNVVNLGGDRIDHLRIDAKGGLSYEGLAAQFKQHPPVGRPIHGWLLLLRPQLKPCESSHNDILARLGRSYY